jgi:hypothetical protein
VVTMKNAVFCYVVLCRSCVNRHFGGTDRLHLWGKKNPQVRNQHEPVASRLKTPSYIRTGREGEWTTWEISREERGRVCRDQVGGPGEQVAERARAGKLGRVGEFTSTKAGHCTVSIGYPKSLLPFRCYCIKYCDM